MEIRITLPQLIELGFDQKFAVHFLERIKNLTEHCHSAEKAWQTLSKNLLTSEFPFHLHLFLYSTLYPDWQTHPELAPAWIPTQDFITKTNLTYFMSELNINDIKSLHSYAVNSMEQFWGRVVEKLNIIFDKNPDSICDLTTGIESPIWFPGAQLNIANSCFNSSKLATAIIYQDTNNHIHTLSYNELNHLSNRVANSLVQQGFSPGDAIGIAMPMNQYAVAIYLGIIKMGGVVVSIADSFSSEEIATRLNIANAKAIFTQDFTYWDGKKLSLYEKVSRTKLLFSKKATSNKLKIIVIPCESHTTIPLCENDCTWDDFLVRNHHFSAVPCDPMSPCNILFSSGTTGTPKAIVWNHTTGIKAASDAYFHQNIQPGDILAWPTNLGWMMGPWLIFAALINRASIALYSSAPKDRAFGEFIQNTKVTMLGVVPTLVATWRQSKCMENLNWDSIKVFSSTGECSNPEDMLYLMSLAKYKPIIEYCGGTEIGGAYITSTVIEKNYPSLFTTPAMGINIAILDENKKPSTLGEVAIIPPSIGLSTRLLNADHHQIYYENMPILPNGKILRRHGDQLKQFLSGHYCILGRVDDTMNLGGIKISAAEIERTLTGLPHIIEIAAIAIPPTNHGPSLLVIYASTTAQLNKQEIHQEMQKRINANLNPLFKIHDLVLIDELPKTASNKIMRRILRKKYQGMKKQTSP
ncbi:MAG: AMP-binding protein [Gammaproteobacteria bacterium]|nr:AMP-binding protein [Gammaproteobacteria bacterium]MCW5582858.1 AMP-binding protein [Gammaproteobacteria bacterium]